MTRQPSAGEIFFRPPTGVYWVDIAVHHNSCRFDLPTAEGVFTFTAEVDVAWRVTEPEQAVKDRPVSGEQVYRPYLERQLRRLSREYAVEHFAIAEREINDHFDKPINLDCGISLMSCSVKLSPEASTHAYLQEATFDHRKAQRREAEHGARMHAAQLQTSENESQHGLQMQTSHQRYELTKFTQQRSLELEQQRMSFYADAIERGDLGPLAYRLASNRSDVNEVIELMMQQKQVGFDAAHSIVKALLNQNLVDKRDAQEILAHVSPKIADLVSPASAGAGPVSVSKPDPVVPPMAALVQDAEALDRSDDDDD